MPNRLAAQSSSYLQQHADNPVDWHPWGGEALALARKTQRPILLSIGYSACHWCHVMAHESFEDARIAALMNAAFINIKVDREERPDLDQIYQAAHALLTGRPGGWPLTLFLTPEQVPFFGGTYFPPETRGALPGFATLLPRVAQFYRDHRDEIGTQTDSLLAALRALEPALEPAAAFDHVPLRRALERLASAFDRAHGGFGAAPKFPHPAELDLCLRFGATSEDAREKALFTLRKMADGGIFDQLGGGFFRYSVDERWAVPHFEKMLYDNGLLLGLYADAFLVSRDPCFQRVVAQTAAWVSAEMQAPDGAYYASLDADSGGVEGAFYLWDRQEAAQGLTPEEWASARLRYGFDASPNVEGRHWHLAHRRDVPGIARELGISPEAVEARLAAARGKLYGVRTKRVGPGRDEKVLVGWNALMIKGMARAGRIFGRPEWVASSRAAMDFIARHLWVQGRLRAVYADGRAHLNAYLDDHAFLLEALLELMQAEFRADDFAFATALAQALLSRFEAAGAGGFFFTSHDHERLIHRPKPAHDQATPSGNGVAVRALNRFAHLAGEPAYAAAASRALAHYYPAMREAPEGFASLIGALEEWLAPPSLVIVRADGTSRGEWMRALSARYCPDVMVLSFAGECPNVPPSLDKPAGAQPTAWVCHGATCQAPIRSLDALLEVLDERCTAPCP